MCVCCLCCLRFSATRARCAICEDSVVGVVCAVCVISCIVLVLQFGTYCLVALVLDCIVVFWCCTVRLLTSCGVSLCLYWFTCCIR